MREGGKGVGGGGAYNIENTNTRNTNFVENYDVKATFSI